MKEHCNVLASKIMFSFLKWFFPAFSKFYPWVVFKSGAKMNIENKFIKRQSEKKYIVDC